MAAARGHIAAMMMIMTDDDGDDDDDDDDDGDHHDVVPHLIPKSLIKELEIGSSLGVSEKSI